MFGAFDTDMPHPVFAVPVIGRRILAVALRRNCASIDSALFGHDRLSVEQALQELHVLPSFTAGHPEEFKRSPRSPPILPTQHYESDILPDGRPPAPCRCGQEIIECL